jgi:glutaredoxin 3
VKEFLSRNGREFTVKQVDDDPEAFNELVALGFMTIPVTIIDDSVVRGFDEKQLRAALGLPAGR